MLGRAVDCFHLGNRGRVEHLNCHLSPVLLVSRFLVPVDPALRRFAPGYLSWCTASVDPMVRLHRRQYRGSGRGSSVSFAGVARAHGLSPVAYFQTPVSWDIVISPARCVHSRVHCIGLLASVVPHSSGRVTFFFARPDFLGEQQHSPFGRLRAGAWVVLAVGSLTAHCHFCSVAKGGFFQRRGEELHLRSWPSDSD